MKHFVHVVGARPNFMKIAPVMESLRQYDVRQTLIHTGQHYDARMSDVFFKDLQLSPPDVFLSVKGGTHSVQTARVMTEIEPHLQNLGPDWVVVAGDVNSTLAAAVTAAKLHIPVAHIEAGLRSFDFSMPEEINRVMTDRISTLLFTHSDEADENLKREGANRHCIHQVGNAMIDTLSKFKMAAEAAFRASGLNRREKFFLVTIHRPANVDRCEDLARLIEIVNAAAEIHPVLFPVHPRTAKMLADSGLTLSGRVHLIDPMGYLDFVGAMQACSGIITDSGGIQEESSWLGVPCVTLRNNTERNVTIRLGTNILIPPSLPNAVDLVVRALSQRPAVTPRIPGWDGCAGRRIARVMMETCLLPGDAYRVL